METFTDTTTYVVETCCKCHIKFGMSRQFRNKRLADHNWFYCPSGHGQHYTGESDVDRLERENKSLQATQTHLEDQLDETRRSRDAHKGHTTRIKNRVSKGVCPCCNRSFVDLRRHMGSKHPDYSAPAR